MQTDVKQRFFEGRDETGRFVIVSSLTGIQYYVEPIEGKNRTEWGSINPATGELVNKKGFQKYSGAVPAKESIVTPENGFRNVVTLGVGESPMGYVDRIDRIRYEEGYRPKGVK